jgi:hypothetical protein
MELERLALVRDILAGLKDKVARLADRECAIREELVRVRGSLSVGNQQITEVANQLAPVSSLPNEVLLMIFEEYRSQSHRKMHSSLLFSHVYRRWRHVSVAASFPWRTIVLDGEYHSAQLYDAFLERSKNSPLEIVISCEDGSLDYLEYDESALDQLSLHIGRWHKVEIVTDEVFWVNAMLERIYQAHAPLLQCINITCYDSSEVDPDIHLVGHTDCTPALSILTLSQNITFRSLRPFQTLKTLRLSVAIEDDIVPSHYFSELLRPLTCLTTLSLRGEVIQYSQMNPLPVVHLPTLLSLEISPKADGEHRLERSMPADYVSHICHSLSTPSLERLAVHFTSPRVISHFSNSLPTRPSKYPCLRSFEMAGPLIRGESTVHLMHALPNIAHFTLVDGPADGVLHVLHADASAAASPLKRSPLWPHLCKLVIGKLDEEGHLLRELVLARLHIGFPINNLQIPLFPLGGHTWLPSIDIYILKKYINLELIPQ